MKMNKRGQYFSRVARIWWIIIDFWGENYMNLSPRTTFEWFIPPLLFLSPFFYTFRGGGKKMSRDFSPPPRPEIICPWSFHQHIEKLEFLILRNKAVILQKRILLCEPPSLRRSWTLFWRYTYGDFASLWGWRYFPTFLHIICHA